MNLINTIGLELLKTRVSKNQTRFTFYQQKFIKSKTSNNAYNANGNGNDHQNNLATKINFYKNNQKTSHTIEMSVHGGGELVSF
jgi:hypothetical protein